MSIVHQSDTDLVMMMTMMPCHRTGTESHTTQRVIQKKRDLYDNFVSFSESFQFHSLSGKV